MLANIVASRARQNRRKFIEYSIHIPKPVYHFSGFLMLAPTSLCCGDAGGPVFWWLMCVYDDYCLQNVNTSIGGGGGGGGGVV